VQLKDIEKWEKASVSPEGLFRDARDAKGQPKYSAFDDEGLPTHDLEGKELSNSSRKVRATYPRIRTSRLLTFDCLSTLENEAFQHVARLMPVSGFPSHEVLVLLL
jgi:hypothetical protein